MKNDESRSTRSSSGCRESDEAQSLYSNNNMDEEQDIQLRGQRYEQEVYLYAPIGTIIVILAQVGSYI